MTKLFDLTGRVAVLTGSTKGMGLAIAKALAEAGASVVISGRDPAAAAKVAEGLGPKARGIACDVTNLDSIRRFARQARDAFGRIDILVCNAASDPPMGPLAVTPADKFDQSMIVATRHNHELIKLVAED